MRKLNAMLTPLVYAPGFIDAAADNFFARIDAALGSNGSTFADATTINLYGSGLNVIAGYADDHGTPQEIFIEAQSNPLDNHKVGLLTDSLALYNLLSTLDPTLNDATPGNLAKLTGILKASSFVAANSLEYTLDTLRTLLQTDYAAGSANLAATATLTDDRQPLHANLQSLQTYLAGTAFNLNLGTAAQPQYAFTLRTLGEAAGAAGLAEASRTDLATRYALYKGNTFVLDAACYQADLYGAINTNGSLDLYDPATHSGELTGQYLTDRAAFVLAKQKANTGDTNVYADYINNAGWAKTGGEEVYYLDKIGSGLPNYASGRIYQGNALAPVDNVKQFQFGSTLNDSLTGGNKDDHLYGMRGDDSAGADNMAGGGVWNTLLAWIKREAANDARYEAERKVA